MELAILLLVVGIFGALVAVAHKIHVRRHWRDAIDAAPQVARDFEEQAAPPINQPQDSAAAQAFIEKYIAEKWREGFLSQDEVLNLAADALEDEFPGSIAIGSLEASLQRAVRQLDTEQASWPPETDNDRLTGVFAKLDAAGIVAAENFSCCNNCGHGEMLGELELERLERSVRGYAFYHAQDTERAAQGGGLYIRFGADSEDEERNAMVGREIVSALVEGGFKPEWDGSSAHGIFLPVTWQRRRSAAGSA
jgi:Domain of unknown function (DUF6891)